MHRHGITVENEFVVNGPSLPNTVVFESNSSLVQLTNAVNTGSIRYERNTTPVVFHDYTYWSSPVASFSSSAISSSTPTGYIYKWTPTISDLAGNWAAGNETMVLGKGYIVRGPNGFGSTPSTFTANFIGVPNNGNITYIDIIK